MRQVAEVPGPRGFSTCPVAAKLEFQEEVLAEDAVAAAQSKARRHCPGLRIGGKSKCLRSLDFSGVVLHGAGGASSYPHRWLHFMVCFAANRCPGIGADRAYLHPRLPGLWKDDLAEPHSQGISACWLTSTDEPSRGSTWSLAFGAKESHTKRYAVIETLD